jgi:hypothetical protein
MSVGDGSVVAEELQVPAIGHVEKNRPQRHQLLRSSAQGIPGARSGMKRGHMWGAQGEECVFEVCRWV